MRRGSIKLEAGTTEPKHLEGMRPVALELDEKYEAKGVYQLMLAGPVRCLPKSRYIVTERQVRILEEKKIPYRRIKLDALLERIPQKV